MQDQDGEKSTNEIQDTPKKPIGILYMIVGWILFAISLFFLPAFLGAGTILMGYLLRRSGREKHGYVMILMGVVGIVIGFTLGAIA